MIQCQKILTGDWQEFSTALFHTLWKTLQEDTWKIGTRHSCIILYISRYQKFEILQVHFIHCNVSFYTLTFPGIFARLRRVFVARFIIWQGECRRFSWEVIPLTLYLNFNKSLETCQIKWYKLMWHMIQLDVIHISLHRVALFWKCP